MNRILAIIRPDKLEVVKQALEEYWLPWFNNKGSKR